MADWKIWQMFNLKSLAKPNKLPYCVFTWIKLNSHLYEKTSRYLNSVTLKEAVHSNKCMVMEFENVGNSTKLEALPLQGPREDGQVQTNLDLQAR